MVDGVLGEILTRKRGDVDVRLANASFDPAPSQRSLRAALAREGARFIFEVKKKSPSGHRCDVGVTAAVEAYAPIADAISVLTDGPFFAGSLNDLSTVRGRFDGPILAKDFVIDPRQVTEARLYGADAVLVIMSALDDVEARRIIAEANRLSMDAVIEVHDEQELGRALALGAEIIGINNRDLRTLKTDLSVTERLAGLVPEDRIVVSESGIRCRHDTERLSKNVDAFLVGSSLMASQNIAQAARALAFGRVKVCGLTAVGDVERVAKAGATHAGFVFAESSPRYVGGDASELAAHASGLGLVPVGVFAGQPASAIIRAIGEAQLQAVQLHDVEQVQQLRVDVPKDCEIWAVSGVDSVVEPTPMGTDRVLFDTRSGGRTGGTGRIFDWNLIAGHAELPNGFIAGGIAPTNARTAQHVGAYGIDLCSSLEIAPGRKDHEQLQALFDALRLPSRGPLPC